MEIRNHSNQWEHGIYVSVLWFRSNILLHSFIKSKKVRLLGGFCSLWNWEKQGYLGLALIPEHQSLRWSDSSPHGVDTTLFPRNCTWTRRERLNIGFFLKTIKSFGHRFVIHWYSSISSIDHYRTLNVASSTVTPMRSGVRDPFLPQV